jgi:hypothetical protein
MYLKNLYLYLYLILKLGNNPSSVLPSNFRPSYHVLEGCTCVPFRSVFSWFLPSSSLADFWIHRGVYVVQPSRARNDHDHKSSQPSWPRFVVPYIRHKPRLLRGQKQTKQLDGTQRKLRGEESIEMICLLLLGLDRLCYGGQSERGVPSACVYIYI